MNKAVIETKHQCQIDAADDGLSRVLLEMATAEGIEQKYAIEKVHRAVRETKPQLRIDLADDDRSGVLLERATDEGIEKARGVVERMRRIF